MKKHLLLALTILLSLICYDLLWIVPAHWYQCTYLMGDDSEEEVICKYNIIDGCMCNQ